MRAKVTVVDRHHALIRYAMSKLNLGLAEVNSIIIATSTRGSKRLAVRKCIRIFTLSFVGLLNQLLY